MGSKTFVIKLILRIVLLLVVLSLISVSYFVLDRSQLIFTFIVLFSILAIQITELVNFITKTNREFYKFLWSLKHSDFQLYYPENGKKKNTNELYAIFNSIIDSFKEVKIDKELQFEFLKLIVEQVKIGIIAINGKDEIILMNSFSEQLLGSHKTKNWSQLSKKQKHFCEEVTNLSEGGSKLIELKNGTQLSLKVGHSILLDEPHQIITFQDIKNEIELKETEAWIRLIRILNHEIMNSVTPISSLTETILLILESNDKPKTAQQIEDVVNCVKTIQKRSNGLYDFVTEYRKLTKIPMPKKELIKVDELFQNMAQLWKTELDKHHIQLILDSKHQYQAFHADPHLIDQVLINLIKNSIQALKKTVNPKLILSAQTINNQIVIQITDNGPGIPSNILSDIFVPFFTTKDKGSGIGLSLSRQIMRMHGGNIRVSSTENKETKFTMEFPIS